MLEKEFAVLLSHRYDKKTMINTFITFALFQILLNGVNFIRESTFYKFKSNN
jgi:hypothetical protein